MLWQQLRVDRTIWVDPINDMRAEKGEYKVLYPDLRLYEDRFFMMYRMSIDKFDELLQMVTPLIEKQNTKYREAVGPEE